MSASLNAGKRSMRAKRVEAHGEHRANLDIAVETPVAIIFNDVGFAVMMASPIDLEDFAHGFSVSEGIVQTIDELSVIQMEKRDDGILLHLMIPPHRFTAINGQARQLIGPSGCGLCGSTALSSVFRAPPKQRSLGFDSNKLNAKKVLQAMARLQAAQQLNHATGATHAAAILSTSNDFFVREDVGRHNAVDKAFGAMARSQQSAALLVVTSRLSFEIVQKAAMWHCPVVAAISAPTSLAIDWANKFGITLIGFAREQRLTVFSGALSQEDSESTINQ